MATLVYQRARLRAGTPIPLNNIWREFVELLNSNGAEYRPYSAIFTVSESGKFREDAPTQNL